MSQPMETADELERRADAARRDVTSSVKRLRVQLRPGSLADEAAGQLKTASSQMVQSAAAKARGPAGASTALAGVAMAAAAIVLRRRRSVVEPSAPQLASSSDSPVDAAADRAANPPPGPPASRPSGKSVADVVTVTSRLAASLALGAVVSRFIPVSSEEHALVQALGGDVRGLIDRVVSRQAARLVHPEPGDSIGVLNLLATGIGLLLSSRNAAATGKR